MCYMTDKRGNRVLIGIDALTLFLYIFCFVFYRTLNKHRERKWNRMSPEVNSTNGCCTAALLMEQLFTGAAEIPRYNFGRGKQEAELPFRLLATCLWYCTCVQYKTTYHDITVTSSSLRRYRTTNRQSGEVWYIEPI